MLVSRVAMVVLLITRGKGAAELECLGTEEAVNVVRVDARVESGAGPLKYLSQIRFTSDVV